MYMQPFCSTTTGCVGASKVRSPKPSETNTITFCRSPFGSAITSCANTGDACCPAQLGSADMLISLGFGTTPSNRTMPFTWAVPFVVVAGEGPAAFTTPTHIASKNQSETVIATTKAKFFAVMIGSSTQDSAFAQLVSPRLRSAEVLTGSTAQARRLGASRREILHIRGDTQPRT